MTDFDFYNESSESLSVYGKQAEIEPFLSEDDATRFVTEMANREMQAIMKDEIKAKS